MPIIPRVQRQVHRDPLPGVRLTAAETEQSSGVGVALAQAHSAESMAGLGGTVAHVAGNLYAAEVQAARDRADSVAILNAQRRLGEWENKRVTAALTVEGKNAMGLPEEVAAEFAAVTGDIAKGLGTDRQRQMFERLKVDRGLGIDLTLRRHVSKEMDRYETEELAGFLVNTVSSGITNANDPKNVLKDVNAGLAAIDTHGANLGMSQQAIDRQKMAFSTQIHAGVIERLIDNENDVAAKVHFQEFKKQISGEAIAKIEKALEEGSLRGESQRQADVIVAAGGTLTEQRAKVKLITDSKTRDQVMQRVEHEAAVADREKTEFEQTRFNDSYNRMEKAGGNLRAILPSVWSAMSPAEKQALRSSSADITRGTPTKTVDSVFYALMGKAADNPEEFADRSKTNLLLLRGKLSEGDFQQLTQMQMSFKHGMQSAQAAAAQKPLDEFLTRKEILDQSLVLYNIDPSAKYDTDEGKRVAQLRRLLDQAVANQVGGEKGKKISNDDIQEHVDSLMISRVSKKGSWWNILPGGEPLYDETKRYIDYTIADVPPTERTAIEKSLRGRSRTVTDQTIVDTFILGQMAAAKKKP